MWTTILSAVFGSLVDVALKLFETFKKKPEDVVREKDAKKQTEVLHDLAHPDSADSKPYTVMHNDDTWGKGHKS